VPKSIIALEACGEWKRKKRVYPGPEGGGIIVRVREWGRRKEGSKIFKKSNVLGFLIAQKVKKKTERECQYILLKPEEVRKGWKVRRHHF